MAVAGEPETKSARFTFACYPSILDIARRHNTNLSEHIVDLLIADLRTRNLVSDDELRDILIGAVV